MTTDKETTMPETPEHCYALDTARSGFPVHFTSRADLAAYLAATASAFEVPRAQVAREVRAELGDLDG